MKLATAALIAAITLLPAFCVYAQEGEIKTEVNLVGVKGIVQDITHYYGTDGNPVEGMGYITVDKGEGDIAVFVYNNDTELPESAPIEVGAEIEAFYDANLPVILIYPPQYTAVRIDVIKESETAAETPSETPETPAETPSDNSSGDIIITIEDTELVDIYGFEQDGFIMVPIRAIAERLGYEVGWEAELKQVTVGNAIRITVGKDEYIFARMAPISLGAPPVIVDNTCYVPLSFFGSVMTEHYGLVLEDAAQAE